MSKKGCLMKYILIFSLFLVTLMAAQYESGKIDMHGGKKNYIKTPSNFGNKDMGMSNFLDHNKTKKTKNK